MRNTFIFLVIGDTVQAEQLTASIKTISPDSNVIQCSDMSTERVKRTDHVFRLPYDGENIMRFRLEAFGKLGWQGAAAYIDTDMLMRRDFSIVELLGPNEVALCYRTFGCGDYINTKFLGLDLSEYQEKTFGEIYPYLACFTVSSNYNFWLDCLHNLETLPKKFLKWYGDQEAIKNIYLESKYKFITIPESKVACLPEFLKFNQDALMLHYKGPRRKRHMQIDFEDSFVNISNKA